MSKYLKNLITKDLSGRLDGVEEAVLVNVVGLTSNAAMALRARLREKKIQLLVVKNSLARRAAEGSPLAAAFEGLGGAAAICWGAEDFVSLAKEVALLDKGDEFKEFKACGGVMDGERLSPEQVLAVSKWPNRTEQLSILSGQISGVAGQLVSQILAPGGALASQIEKKSEGAEAAEGAEGAGVAEGDAPPAAGEEGSAS